MEVPHPLPYASVEEELYASEAGEHWRRIGTDPHHGIVVPLFSLRSTTSCGIGEFTDLLPLIELCAKCKMDIIQLLPINDTGLDASPYAALSAFALNPIYLGLDALPYLDDEDRSHPAYGELKDYNGGTRIAYPEVRHLKMAFLRAYCQRHKERLLAEPDYRHYVQSSPWLPDYALFSALHRKNLHRGWESWPEREQNPSQENLQALQREHREEATFHQLLQYLCDRQMGYVRHVADKAKVLLMGDVPILVGRDSCDVWRHRDYFNLDLVAGAPPDVYTADGQNWGLPCYQWEVLEADNFRWWEERLSVVARHFHLYRVDHIIGFFRIWAIPFKQPASEGVFTPGVFPDWYEQGVKLMRMLLSKSPLLPIGEDLGVIPPVVRRTLALLGIPGTKVLRWERWPEGHGPFTPQRSYPHASLTTLSTHDAENMRLYWQRYPGDSRELAHFLNLKWERVLPTDHLAQILKWSHATSSLFHVNPIQEYLALEPDFTSRSLERERVNLPGTLSILNWSWRLPCPIETLLHHPTFSKKVADLLPN
ncbi:MAG: 4-alpha-glucanotransferase [Parachlamydiales bacterium]